jgi:hypothetical protein
MIDAYFAINLRSKRKVNRGLSRVQVEIPSNIEHLDPTKTKAQLI